MQNEFEKQVQKKLEELKLHPSAPVWQHIKKEIAPGKERKRILFWLLFGAVVTAAGFYLLEMTPAAKMVSANKHGFSPARHPGTNTLAKPQPAPTRRTGDTTDRVVLPAAPARNSTGAWQHTAVTKERLSTDVSVSTMPLTEVQNFGALNTRRKADDPPIGIPARKASSAEDASGKNRTGNSVHPKPAEAAPQPGDSATTLLADSAIAVRKVQDEFLEHDSLATPAGQRKTRKLFAVIHASIGRSKLASGLALFDKNFADYFSAPGSSSGFPPSNGLPPAGAKPGLSFGAGLSVKKTLNRHFSLSAGLDYNFYSTRISTGQRIWNDTVITSGYGSVPLRSYYQNTNATGHSYANKFHFISLPLRLEYKISDRIPLSITAGISLQQLVSTNALIYHSTGQFYYQDKKAFQKSQLFSEFGISYGCRRFNLGPSLQYGLTKTMRQGNGNKHLFTAGLKAGFVLNK